MSTYVQVSAFALVTHLKSRGFWEIDNRFQRVFVKAHPDCSRVLVKVYTSIPPNGSSVRRRGKDSIRVCTVVNGRGVGKFKPVPRVHSTESVLRRLDDRIDRAKTRGIEWIRETSVQRVMRS